MVKITIRFNGSTMDVIHGTRLSEFAEELEIDAIGTAIAIDGTIISKDEWNKYVFTSSVSITIFQAIAGG